MDLRHIKLRNLLIEVGVIALLVGVSVNLSSCTPYFGKAEILSVLPVNVSGGLRATHPTPPSPTSYAPVSTSYPLTPGLDTPVGTLPARIRIPAIGVDAPVVPIGWEVVNVDDLDSQNGSEGQAMWQVPDRYAAGWHKTSAKLGVPGNTVLNGHNTMNGEVFRYVYKLEPGAFILMDDKNGATYTYQVQHVYILPEAGQPMEVRVQNARYIQATEDERLTLVTCHPYGSLRNRLVVIAFPASGSEERE